MTPKQRLMVSNVYRALKAELDAERMEARGSADTDYWMNGYVSGLEFAVSVFKDALMKED